jgi:hypothetical protein
VKKDRFPVSWFPKELFFRVLLRVPAAVEHAFVIVGRRVDPGRLPDGEPTDNLGTASALRSKNV